MPCLTCCVQRRERERSKKVMFLFICHLGAIHEIALLSIVEVILLLSNRRFFLLNYIFNWCYCFIIKVILYICYPAEFALFMVSNVFVKSCRCDTVIYKHYMDL